MDPREFFTRMITALVVNYMFQQELAGFKYFGPIRNVSMDAEKVYINVFIMTQVNPDGSKHLSPINASFLRFEDIQNCKIEGNIFTFSHQYYGTFKISPVKS